MNSVMHDNLPSLLVNTKCTGILVDMLHNNNNYIHS